MAKKSVQPKVRIHLWLLESDVEALKAMYQQTVGVSKVVRTLVSHHVKTVQAKSAQKLPQIMIETDGLDE